MNNIFNEIKALFKTNNFVTEESADNLIAYIPGKGKKIMISVVVPDKKLIVKKIEKNRAEFEATWNLDKLSAANTIVYKDDHPVGVIRFEKDKDYISLYADEAVKIGDILEIKYETMCKDNILYTTNSNIEFARITAKKLSEQKNDTIKGIHFIVSKTGCAALSLANAEEPDCILSLYPTQSNDSFEIGGGCGIILKDGNAVTDTGLYDFLNDLAKKSNIKAQPFVGKKNNMLERLGLIGKGAKVGGICVPCDGCDGVWEVLSLEDINAAVDLLAAFLTGGNETEEYI